ncbi:hypothetical protein AC578_4869 [Pseudocercospora eumusae]|uniref:BTB domain-containing protein n=1 Tax=Pseudocercospora eumusae TaxID=321146 RepID=A0A139HC90_9PEZI|nr:hypothetical protein AC578_4869 [Pseudocercospora eumusae]
MADSIETVDPYGDIILVVGTNEGQKKLRVSSERLSNSSPVFKALLGPQYSEGNTIRTSEKPIEVALPDDDADSMRLVCILTHRTDIPDQDTNVSVERLLAFAIVVDKYHISGALRFQSQGLLLSCLCRIPDPANAAPSSSLRSLDRFAHRVETAIIRPDVHGILVAAAYLLKEPSAFKVATEKFINDGRLVSGYLDEPFWSRLPIRLIVVLAERAVRKTWHQGIIPGLDLAPFLQIHDAMA